MDITVDIEESPITRPPLERPLLFSIPFFNANKNFSIGNEQKGFLISKETGYSTTFEQGEHSWSEIEDKNTVVVIVKKRYKATCCARTIRDNEQIEMVYEIFYHIVNPIRLCEPANIIKDTDTPDAPRFETKLKQGIKAAFMKAKNNPKLIESDTPNTTINTRDLKEVLLAALNEKDSIIEHDLGLVIENIRIQARNVLPLPKPAPNELPLLTKPVELPPVSIQLSFLQKNDLTLEKYWIRQLNSIRRLGLDVKSSLEEANGSKNGAGVKAKSNDELEVKANATQLEDKEADVEPTIFIKIRKKDFIISITRVSGYPTVPPRVSVMEGDYAPQLANCPALESWDKTNPSDLAIIISQLLPEA